MISTCTVLLYSYNDESCKSITRVCRSEARCAGFGNVALHAYAPSQHQAPIFPVIYVFKAACIDSYLTSISPSSLSHVTCPSTQAFPCPSPSSNSTGRFIPTLLALKRTRSSSVIPIPGLYRSSSVAYVRCACTYCTNCSPSCNWLSVLEFGLGVERVERMRCCNFDGAESFWCCVRVVWGVEGSSRRRRR